MDSKYKENIAKNITKYLDLTEKKRADLAARLDTTVAAISRFCLSQSTPTVDQLVVIANFFNVSLNDLFGIKENSNLSDDEVKR